MAQRILQQGEIETLAQRSIPRIRLPEREVIFHRRAARLRELVKTSAIGDYLRLVAAIADAQHQALRDFPIGIPTPEALAAAAEHSMPPLPANGWARPAQWRDVLRGICAHVAAQPGFPDALRAICERLSRAGDADLEARAEAILAQRTAHIDIAAAPFVMAALQVCWVASSAALVAAQVTPLESPGLCPLCGSLPVASVVYAQSGYQGYRYLHCALCACEWHLVRVLCSCCGAGGKAIGYHSMQAEADAAIERQDASAVRAESCDTCHGYRKILYQEKDPGVEPVADDLASLGLDLLLAEHGYQRASGNPMLWQAAAD